MSAYENIEDDISKFKFMRKPITIAKLLQIVKNTIAEKQIQTSKEIKY
jgi:hypothetical protein